MTSIPLTVLRTGVRRGLIEFRNVMQTPSELFYYLFGLVAAVVALIVFRDASFDDSGMSVALYVLPGVLVMQVLITACLGPATVLATEREDGTLLRAKSLPHGMAGYVTGLSVRSMLEAVAGLLIVLVPAVFIVEGLVSRGAWLLATIPILVLGLLSVLPFGFAMGALVRNPRVIGGWGFVVVAILAAGSGLFFPVTLLPGWAQVIAMILPLYWFGHAMRAVVLPEGMVVLEPGESWRVLEALGVLGIWAVVGLVLAPALLRRMARRESGSAMERRRQAAMQRV